MGVAEEEMEREGVGETEVAREGGSDLGRGWPCCLAQIRKRATRYSGKVRSESASTSARVQMAASSAVEREEVMKRDRACSPEHEVRGGQKGRRKRHHSSWSPLQVYS